MKRVIYLFFAFTLITISAGLAQSKKEIKKKFWEAEDYLIAGNYREALDIFKYLDSIKPGNTNVSFKIALCYLHSATNKRKAIPYLEKAIKNTTKNYKEGSITEKRTPLSSYFYLAKAYHLNYEFDKAIEQYEKYKTFVAKRNKEDIDDSNREIETCNNGKELIKTPIDVKISNLGPKINGEYPDYSPVVSLDEKTLVFTSRRDSGTSNLTDEDGQYFEDIFISQKDSLGNWTKAKPIGANINSLGHEASINISGDGSKLLIYKDDNNNGNLYMSKLTGEEWGSPEYMGSDINTGSWETHACLSSDNRILYFTSDRPGGFGGRDIYKCLRLPNGEWSPAQNLGAIINTKYDEDGIFIHPDGKQIFFASKGHKSMGGFDIFTSTINDENGFWSEPVNVGYPVNTPDEDLFLITSADGKRGYFSSGKEGGYGDMDIYLIDFPNVVEKDITVLIGKFIKNEGCDLTVNEVTVTDTKTGEMIEIYSANSSTGKFGFSLPPGTSYEISYSIAKKEIKKEIIEVAKGQGYQVILRDLPCGEEIIASKDTIPPPVKPGREITAGYSLFFKYNVKEIDLNDKVFIAFIDSIAEMLKVNPTIQINIESSASRVPTKTFKTNENLSKARAEEALVKITEALTLKGIKSSQWKFKTIPLVQGPAYKGDYIENKAVYEKYQYIKIDVKPMK